MGTKDHRESAAKEGSARCAILTVTDTKTRDTDTSGKAAFEIFQKFGHSVVSHDIVPNEKKKIASAAEQALKQADLLVTIGGTGASKKDISVESVAGLIEKELPGFGEMFRSMSVKEIGTAAILSRAVLGITGDGKIVLSLPGAENAVRLGLEGILMNELKHLLWEVRRHA